MLKFKISRSVQRLASANQLLTKLVNSAEVTSQKAYFNRKQSGKVKIPVRFARQVHLICICR